MILRLLGIVINYEKRGNVMSDERDDNTGSGMKVRIIIFLVVILVLGGLVFGWIKLTPGYLTRKAAIKNYYASITNEDGKLYKNTCYTKKWQDNFSSLDSGKNIDAIINEAFEYQSGAKYDDVKITVMEKLDKDIASAMTEQINKIYGVDVKVGAVSKVNFEVSSEFEGEKISSGTITRYCYRSAGKWYFLADPDIIIALDIEG